ncbi:MAG: cytosine permease [Bacteroidota bacterium]
MSENNQYTTSKVEEQDFTSGWAVALIIAGTGVSLPILFLGAEISLQAGFQDAMWAFGLSTVVLTSFCLATTLIGNRSRLSTYMILRFPFGKKGAHLINFIIGISLLGWFSVALELLAQAINDTSVETLGVEFPLWTIIIVASIFITVTTIYGIRSIEKLANITVPILLLFLMYVVYKCLSVESEIVSITSYLPSSDKMSLFDATSTLVGSSILLPVLMADFSRFIYNDKQSLVAVLGVTIGFPLVLVISALTAIQTGEVDIIQIMKSVDLIIPAFILLFATTWFTNATNLYSISLTFSTMFPILGFRIICISTSICGTVLALFGFSDYLFDFLNILGVFTPSVSAIYIIDFFLIKKQRYELDEIPVWGRNGLIAWAISSSITMSIYLDYFQLTQAYFIDSFLLAGLIYVWLERKQLTLST